MSLVHEALQKAEREKQRKLGTAPSPPISHATPQPTPTPVGHAPAVAAPVASVTHAISQQPVTSVEGPPKTNNFLLPALIGCVAIVAMVAVGFLVGNATSMLRQSRENSPVVTPAAPAPVAQATSPAALQATAPQPIAIAAPAAVPPTAAPVADESKYKLSGIMKDPDGKPVAVLNGRVAYEGYYIDGATVKKIETDRAILDVRGQEVVLRLF